MVVGHVVASTIVSSWSSRQPPFPCLRDKHQLETKLRSISPMLQARYSLFDQQPVATKWGIPVEKSWQTPWPLISTLKVKVQQFLIVSHSCICTPRIFPIEETMGHCPMAAPVGESQLRRATSRAPHFSISSCLRIVTGEVPNPSG